MLKTNPLTNKFQELNKEKMIRRFYEKELLLRKISMSYYPQPDSNVRNKIKLELDLYKIATKKELYLATGVGTSDLAAKKDFIALKAQVDKLDIAKLVNVPTSLNNLKTKVDDIDDGELKTVLIDLKKLNDVVDNEVVKITKLKTLKAKLINLNKKIPDASA